LVSSQFSGKLGNLRPDSYFWFLCTDLLLTWGQGVPALPAPAQSHFSECMGGTGANLSAQAGLGGMWEGSWDWEGPGELGSGHSVVRRESRPNL
jgi:hypothetical protein